MGAAGKGWQRLVMARVPDLNRCGEDRSVIKVGWTLRFNTKTPCGKPTRRFYSAQKSLNAVD